MLFRSPTMPADPDEHSPTSPPISPIPGTWHTPPGAAGVTTAVRCTGVRAAGAVWAAVLRDTGGALAACVAAIAALATASNAPVISSTPAAQRARRRPRVREAARSGARRWDGASGTSIGETPGWCGYGEASAARVVRVGPGPARPGGVGVDPVPQFA